MKKEEIAGFTFKAGTIISIGDHQIVLTEDSTIHFDGADCEEKVVGLLVVSKNLDANRAALKKNYNGFGIEIPGDPEPVVIEDDKVVDDSAKSTSAADKTTAPKSTAPKSPAKTKTKATPAKTDSEPEKAPAENTNTQEPASE